MNNITKKILNEKAELIKQGRCPFCKLKVIPSQLKDKLSREEYRRTGVCQRCQDKTVELLDGM